MVDIFAQDPEKQDGVGDLFGGTVNSDEFFKLVTIGKMITDFQSPEDPQEGDVLAGDALDEEAGVAVEFEGEDADDDDDDGDEVMVSGSLQQGHCLLPCITKTFLWLLTNSQFSILIIIIRSTAK